MEIFGFASGPYKTNCFVVINDGAATVIDPGMHTYNYLVEYFEEHNVTLEQILLTHGHIDHTRDAGTLAARYHAPVYIHPSDAFMLEDGKGVSAESRVLFDAANMTPIKDLRHLSHGDELKIGGEIFHIRHAPGHSPGSVLIVGDEVVFAGDVLFKGSIGRTDLMQSDPEAMDQSLKNQVLTLSDELQVLPGHGPLTTMRAERRTNPFLARLP
ncbi:MBL fold metallo-hydrolase [Corynebacterium felinum]|uniref:Glyoxylase-like metal-dependent hydrolase (Beta-lactamase superfamily II) n=1 Tax=Corynebacterium felinum TaxID=131318 RepID=A0ABU2BB19_9CORY|nr:MBL fold metallo-hydrolase [Corynebacterium felinum]MDF5821917.1 MBL fold metallo-hydrolase [Corynebacterium felinum]MDR7355793.1 glyoxylase-like metal-dependent hydrolase (beta-lactamase superfamily II) [Corynebacterium felinum]WJY95139.1 putative metallo-hydrolase [Corynebacterium felinum]